MATWTIIPDTDIAQDKPIKAETGLALRDNAIAIAEGAAGAPRIQTAALDSGVVVNGKVANGTLGAEKFQTGTDERNWVRSRIAENNDGAPGSYVFARPEPPGSNDIDPGDTISGSDLTASDMDNKTGGGSLSGTWRAMGHARYTGGTNWNATLFLRIS